MARKVRIAAIQIPGWAEGKSAREKYACNLKNIEMYLGMAGEGGCDITAIGENSNLRGLSQSERQEVLGPLLDGPEVELGARSARKFSMNVVLGIGGLHEGKRRNAGIVISRTGQVAGMYFKVQLPRNEQVAGVVAGDDFPVFELDFGKIGVVICHDLSFVETTRILSLRGAEVIIWPSNWSGWGRDLSNCIIRCRALDAGAYLVFLSHGQDPRKPMNWMGGVTGCTGIVSPMGEFIAQMPHRIPGIVSAEVDLDIRRVAHNFTYDRDDVFIEEMLSERRPEAYGPICDPSLVRPPPRQYKLG